MTEAAAPHPSDSERPTMKPGETWVRDSDVTLHDDGTVTEHSASWHPSDSERTPRTEAGRDLYELLHNDERWVIDNADPILAIEAESERVSLDVERLEGRKEQVRHFLDYLWELRQRSPDADRVVIDTIRQYVEEAGPPMHYCDDCSPDHFRAMDARADHSLATIERAIPDDFGPFWRELPPTIADVRDGTTMVEFDRAAFAAAILARLSPSTGTPETGE